MLTAILGVSKFWEDNLQSVNEDESLESYERLVIYFDGYLPSAGNLISKYSLEQIRRFFYEGKPIICILPSRNSQFRVPNDSTTKSMSFIDFFKEFFGISIEYEKNKNFTFNEMYVVSDEIEIYKTNFILYDCTNLIGVVNTDKTVAGKSSKYNIYLFPDDIDYIKCLEIVDRYENEYEVEIPEWISRYPILNEQLLKEQSDNMIQTIEELNQQNLQIQDTLDEYIKIKELIYTQDTPLEISVHTLFKRIGLNSVHLKDNEMEDIQIENDDKLLCIEIKGLKKNVNKKYILQASNWVDEHIKSGRENVFGLIIVNHYCNLHPDDRDYTLPENLSILLSKREITMMYTTDLLKIFEKYLPWTNDKAQKFFSILVNTTGLLLTQQIIEMME